MLPSVIHLSSPIPLPIHYLQFASAAALNLRRRSVGSEQVINTLVHPAESSDVLGIGSCWNLQLPGISATAIRFGPEQPPFASSYTRSESAQTIPPLATVTLCCPLLSRYRATGRWLHWPLTLAGPQSARELSESAVSVSAHPPPPRFAESSVILAPQLAPISPPNRCRTHISHSSSVSGPPDQTPPLPLAEHGCSSCWCCKVETGRDVARIQ